MRIWQKRSACNVATQVSRNSSRFQVTSSVRAIIRSARYFVDLRIRPLLMDHC